MDISTVRSDHIRQRLGEGSLEDHAFRGYIEKLMRLESFILKGGPQSFWEGIDFYFLRTTHAKDYSMLLQELRPESHGG
jgi:hypothetical protein